MTMDDLDQILVSDEKLTPPSDYVARVMSRLRAEAVTGGPIPFPWVRFASGVAALAVIAELVARTDAVSRANNLLWNQVSSLTTAVLDPSLQIAACMTLISFAGSFLLVWGSLGLTGGAD